MLGFVCRRELLIVAPPQVVFDILADLSRHGTLAGSGEVLRIRKLTEGPVGVGTRFEADEDIRMGPARSRFLSTSEVGVY